MVSLSHFDAQITAGSVLQHYFYKHLWNEGKLTKKDLQIYAKEYFHLAKRVPAIVEHVRVRALEARPDLVAFIEENLREEQEHAELWKRFGVSLGLTAEEMDAHQPVATVTDAVSKLETLAQGSFEQGVATMYALELDLPNIARTKKDGLCAHYGHDESDADAHAYFDEHLKEELHLQVWRQVPVNEAMVQSAVTEALALQHKVLDGVCEASGLAMC